MTRRGSGDDPGGARPVDVRLNHCGINPFSTHLGLSAQAIEVFALIGGELAASHLRFRLDPTTYDMPIGAHCLGTSRRAGSETQRDTWADS